MGPLSESLFDAETFCTEHGLDVNSAIEYRDDPELKNNIQTIAQYQKAILQELSLIHISQAEEPAPKTDANPPRRTRKKREE